MKRRKIVYLDEAMRKKETEALTSAEEIEFFRKVKQNNYTVLGTTSV